MKRKTLFNLFFVLSLVFGSLLIQPAAVSFAQTGGDVWAWGGNWNGELGDGTTTDRLSPVQVSGLTEVTAIAGGRWGHSLALKSDGTVWAWGYNQYGQLGDGTTTSRSIPVQVSGLTGVTAIAAGAHHIMALNRQKRKSLPRGCNRSDACHTATRPTNTGLAASSWGGWPDGSLEGSEELGKAD